jgi:hypothetical protein
MTNRKRAFDSAMMETSSTMRTFSQNGEGYNSNRMEIAIWFRRKLGKKTRKAEAVRLVTRNGSLQGKFLQHSVYNLQGHDYLA